MAFSARWMALAAVIVAVAVPSLAVQAASPADAFLAGINHERASQGLSALTRHWDLDDDAGGHAQAMAASGQVSRLSNLEAVTSGWTMLAEYQAKGRDVGQLVRGGLASERHRAQLLGAYDSIGVGVRSGVGGELYLAVVLMRSEE